MTARVALVTGGTGAIGSEICKALAAAGCKLGALGHPSEAPRIAEWKTRLKIDVAVELCDLGDFTATGAAIRKLKHSWARPTSWSMRPASRATRGW